MNKFIQTITHSVTHWFKRERKTLLLSLCFAFVFTIAFAFATNAYSDTIQNGIARQVVRFHVLANSNSEADQALKLKVRDGVLERMQPLINNSKSFDETKTILSNNLDIITACAKDIINENGYDYSVSAAVTKSIFPTKTYGDIAFPAGQYDALRIEIGEAEGNNWWCVMFPPLCYVDVTQDEGSKQSKEDLKHILTDNEYDVVAGPSDDLPVIIKFKIVEWWQEIKNSIFF